MKTIKILGTGCPNCKTTEKVVLKATQELNIEANIIKVEDIQDIMAYDIMSTPAVVIDEIIVVKGRVPSLDEIKKLLQEDSCCTETDDCCTDTVDDTCCSPQKEDTSNSTSCCC